MRGFEQIPWLYDLAMRALPGLQPWRRELVAEARGRVLEVGCGTGLMLSLYPPDTDLVALDVHREPLERARARGHGAAILHASVERLPFADASFDAVVSGLVFCSVPDPSQGLGEIRRVLKPGGRLLMLEHVQARNRFGRGVLNAVQPVWTTLAGGCHPNRETENIVERAGFVIETDGYRAQGLMRRFSARPAGDAAAD
jgi:ubiquinone/menaquinone biosynthesis C-methylase UbiE